MLFRFPKTQRRKTVIVGMAFRLLLTTKETFDLVIKVLCDACELALEQPIPEK